MEKCVWATPLSMRSRSAHRQTNSNTELCHKTRPTSASPMKKYQETSFQKSRNFKRFDFDGHDRRTIQLAEVCERKPPQQTFRSVCHDLPPISWPQQVHPEKSTTIVGARITQRLFSAPRPRVANRMNWTNAQCPPRVLKLPLPICDLVVLKKFPPHMLPR